MKNTWTYEDQMIFESDLRDAILNTEPIPLEKIDYIQEEGEEDEYCYSFF